MTGQHERPLRRLDEPAEFPSPPPELIEDLRRLFPPVPVSRFMTREEAAAYARCAPITIYRAWAQYRRTGHTGLRASQPGGPNGRLLFDPADVDRWLSGEAPHRRR